MISVRAVWWQRQSGLSHQSLLIRTRVEAFYLCERALLLLFTPQGGKGRETLHRGGCNRKNHYPANKGAYIHFYRPLLLLFSSVSAMFLCHIGEEVEEE